MWTLLLSRVEDPRTYIDRRQIDGGQIKIGRAINKCDWVIPDHEGYVSREHCTIIVSGLDLFVLDTSTYGTVLNDASVPIAPHQPVAIRVHDKLILGDYIIEIAPEGALAGEALAPPPPPPLLGGGSVEQDRWFQPAADPIWNPGTRDAEVHEFLGGAFNDFLGTESQTPYRDTGEAFGARGLGAAFSKPIMAPMNPTSSDFGIPENWDMGGVAPTPAAVDHYDSRPNFAPVDPLPFGDDPFDLGQPAGARGESDPFGSGPLESGPLESGPAPWNPGSADDLFGSSFPPLPEEHGAGGVVPPMEGGSFTDFFPPPASDQPLLPPIAPESLMPLLQPADLAPEGVEAVGTAGTGEWAAFCEGAGINPDDLRRSPDAMRRLGVLYRQVVLGLSDLIQDRAAFKNEFRLGVTTLAMGRNNPLKMLEPLDAARLMLDEPMPGFMASEEAVRSAFEDIKKHQMAMLAGVQHALTAVFKRLAPAEIDRLMEKAAGERRGLPFRRGIDAWTVYRTVFEALRVDATSNANSVMSVAFREGYEAFLKGDPGRS